MFGLKDIHFNMAAPMTLGRKETGMSFFEKKKSLANQFYLQTIARKMAYFQEYTQIDQSKVS